MKLETLKAYIYEQYGIVSDHPWPKYPWHEVYRHRDTEKWFAISMSIDQRKLGREEERMVTIVNVKSDPELILELRKTKGYAKAYHMNKQQWITIILEEQKEEQQVFSLVDMSYEMTKKRGGKRK